jgi:adenosylmethionine-8-amino-7-oxononanoate aminotransferase
MRVNESAMKRGLLLYPMQGCALDPSLSAKSSNEGRTSAGIPGDHVMIAPPAVTSTEDVRWAVEQLKSAIEEAQRTWD